MISLSLKKLAEVVGAAPGEFDDAGFSGVTIDSRQSCADKLFVAIKGDNFDGHQFVQAAFQNGAVAALVETPQDCAIAQLQVADCKRAMAQLANYWRHHCNPCVIALTGSNGKTTVKEMLSRVLSAQAPTLATQGNFNNDIGVPLTLFGLKPGHEYAVVEMGANHRGEIACLARIAEPDIVYVNNVAAAHLAGFGDIQGVIEAKGELYAWCGPSQSALFNVDEVASQYWREHCAAQTRLDCGLTRAADVSASWSIVDERLAIEFSYRGRSATCELGVIGEHNVRNALAAVSLALLAGLELETAAAKLSGFAGVKGRLQILAGPARSRLIDDSYNANPDSLEAGIKVLCSLQGESWLALGDMGELGDDEVELHREAARSARRQGVDRLFGVGEMSCIASDEFGDGGSCYDDIDELAQVIRAQIYPGVNLLVKGSRAAGMERLVKMLTQTNGVGDCNAV
jgi:UDP-N-acetylmuramoyl-tripeptide--D-alanyl-D-alanine ligase